MRSDFLGSAIARDVLIFVFPVHQGAAARHLVCSFFYMRRERAIATFAESAFVGVIDQSRLLRVAKLALLRTVRIASRSRFWFSVFAQNTHLLFTGLVVAGHENIGPAFVHTEVEHIPDLYLFVPAAFTAGGTPRPKRLLPAVEFEYLSDGFTGVNVRVFGHSNRGIARLYCLPGHSCSHYLAFLRVAFGPLFCHNRYIDKQEQA